jgi:chromosome segregation ATPase
MSHEEQDAAIQLHIRQLRLLSIRSALKTLVDGLREEAAEAHAEVAALEASLASARERAAALRNRLENALTQQQEVAS